VHTNENTNKKPFSNKGGTNSGPKNTNVKPGEQVASNRAMHCNMKLWQRADGEYDAVVERGQTFTLIRGEYYPIGSSFHYPQVWGRKYAATKLLQSIIQDKQKIIQDAQAELDKLQRCLNRVSEWSDTDQ